MLMETGRSREHVDAKAPDPVPGFNDATGDDSVLGTTGVLGDAGVPGVIT
jgi:hypothetical protein